LQQGRQQPLVARERIDYEITAGEYPPCRRLEGLRSFLQ